MLVFGKGEAAAILQNSEFQLWKILDLDEPQFILLQQFSIDLFLARCQQNE